MDKKYIKFNLTLEYPGLVGESSMAIITELSMEQLLAEFPELKTQLPFSIFTTVQWENFKYVFKESWNNDMKHKMRDIRHGDIDGYVEGNTENLIRNYVNFSAECEFNKKIDSSLLEQAIKHLNENQKRRIKLYYFQGITYREIADIEGVSDMSIHESINGAIKK